jgi:hypothetical protein
MVRVQYSFEILVLVTRVGDADLFIDNKFVDSTNDLYASEDKPGNFRGNERLKFTRGTGSDWAAEHGARSTRRPARRSLAKARVGEFGSLWQHSRSSSLSIPGDHC